MFYLLLIGGLGGVFYLLKQKGITFSGIEKSVVAKLAEEEARAFADFKLGKEAIIAEYERLKLRTESLVSLKAKLPAPAAPVVVVQPSVTPSAPTIVQPVVAVAPVVVVPAPVETPIVVDPNAAQTL